MGVLPFGLIPVSQKGMDLLVCPCPFHRRSILRDRQQRLFDDVVRDGWVQEVEGFAQSVSEDDFVDGVTAEGAGWAEGLGVGVDDDPPEISEEVECGLFDEFSLGVVPWSHVTYPLPHQSSGRILLSHLRLAEVAENHASCEEGRFVDRCLGLARRTSQGPAQYPPAFLRQEAQQ